VTKSDAAAQAKAFVDLVLGPDGQAILRKYGFAQ
jgi:ABC-type molybdate transport system substrate-binding protein